VTAIAKRIAVPAYLVRKGILNSILPIRMARPAVAALVSETTGVDSPIGDPGRKFGLEPICFYAQLPTLSKVIGVMPSVKSGWMRRQRRSLNRKIAPRV
jgi:hypothetical protein